MKRLLLWKRKYSYSFTYHLFDATKSYDPDGDELIYYWDFGDGKSTKGPLVLHRYPFGGSFKAILTVDDQLGLGNSFFL